jgi:hypothetical protein
MLAHLGKGGVSSAACGRPRHAACGRPAALQLVRRTATVAAGPLRPSPLPASAPASAPALEVAHERPRAVAGEVAAEACGVASTSDIANRPSLALVGLAVAGMCGASLLVPGAGYASGGTETLTGGALELFRSFLVGGRQHKGWGGVGGRRISWRACAGATLRVRDVAA